MVFFINFKKYFGGKFEPSITLSEKENDSVVHQYNLNLYTKKIIKKRGSTTFDRKRNLTENET